MNFKESKRLNEGRSQIKNQSSMRVGTKSGGEFPALMKIVRACKANIGLKGIELTTVLREMRQEYGINYSHASGRFTWTQ